MSSLQKNRRPPKNGSNERIISCGEPNTTRNYTNTSLQHVITPIHLSNFPCANMANAFPTLTSKRSEVITSHQPQQHNQKIVSPPHLALPKYTWRDRRSCVSYMAQALQAKYTAGLNQLPLRVHTPTNYYIDFLVQKQFCKVLAPIISYFGLQFICFNKPIVS